VTIFEESSAMPQSLRSDHGSNRAHNLGISLKTPHRSLPSIRDNDVLSETAVPRQFGLKPTSTAEQQASTACGKRPHDVNHSAIRDETSAPLHSSPPLVPLYAPASWRGSSERRCISAD
jgi:hypothetical protein